MLWIFLACSSANYSTKGVADAAEEEMWDEDTAYYDAETAEESEPDDDNAWTEEAKWWKLSADIILANDEIEVYLTRDLYSEDMTFICEQTLVFERALQFDSPFGGDERWFLVNLTDGENYDCPYTRTETELQFGIGPLISDLAVATEMVEWDNESDAEILAAVEPEGAYILDSNQDSIIGYGLSYSVITEAEAEWISLRPIYSFAW